MSVLRPRFTARKFPELIASYNAVRPMHATAHASVTVYANGVFMFLAMLSDGITDKPAHVSTTYGEYFYRRVCRKRFSVVHLTDRV